MAALFPPIIFAIVEVQLLANPDGSEGDKPDERLASVNLDLEVAHSRWGVVNEAAPARPGSAFGRRHSVQNKFVKLQRSNQTASGVQVSAPVGIFGVDVGDERASEAVRTLRRLRNCLEAVVPTVG